MAQSNLGVWLAGTALRAYNSLRFGASSMEARMGQAMQDSVSLRKASVPWEADQPVVQPYHVFDAASSSWIPKTPSATDSHDADAATDKGVHDAGNNGLQSIALYSWNIDFMLPFGDARMRTALAHLASQLELDAHPPTAALVIFLQECTPGDLATIAATPWVRDRFHLSDVDSATWATDHYGTVTLVDARLPPAAIFRVHFAQTRMDRDGLFVDLQLQGRTVRLCNTHLESLALNPPYRPPQMQLVARHLHADGIHAGLAAGDFNAIQPFDRTLHTDNGLKDAFLELGGNEDTDESYTWGQQASTKLRDMFGCSRMDKVFFCGDLELLSFQRFGADVLVEGEDEGLQITALGFDKPWVTDHLGIKAELKVGTSPLAARL